MTITIFHKKVKGSERFIFILQKSSKKVKKQEVKKIHNLVLICRNTASSLRAKKFQIHIVNTFLISEKPSIYFFSFAWLVFFIITMTIEDEL